MVNQNKIIKEVEKYGFQIIQFEPKGNSAAAL